TFQRYAQLSVDIAAREIRFRSVEVVVLARHLAAENAELRLENQSSLLRNAGIDADDSAQRVIAVQTGRGSVHDFHLGRIHQWDARPVNPAAERIIKWCVVEHHQVAPATTWANASQ